jgi:hypothetical protein
MLLRICFTVLRIWISFTDIDQFYGYGSVLRKWISFTDYYRKLYVHGIQFFFLCVLSIAMSVSSAPTAGCSVGLSLYAALPIALTIVHFDGTPILSLHNRHSLFTAKP